MSLPYGTGKQPLCHLKTMKKEARNGERPRASASIVLDSLPRFCYTIPQKKPFYSKGGSHMARRRSGPTRPCRIFLCYRRETAQTAITFKGIMDLDPTREYGNIWYSNLEGVGNFILDVPNLIGEAEWVIFFVGKAFTAGFLDENEINPDCVTAMELIAIEKERQKRKREGKPLKLMTVNVDGGCIDRQCGKDLKQLFLVAGILQDDSVAAYKGLNQNPYHSVSTLPHDFIEEHVAPYCALPAVIAEEPAPAPTKKKTETPQPPAEGEAPGPVQKPEAPASVTPSSPGGESAEEESCDELLPAAVEIVLETGICSVSMLQRRLKLGYARAAHIVDEMEERGIVGPFEGFKPRSLLITKEQWASIGKTETPQPPAEREAPGSVRQLEAPAAAHTDSSRHGEPEEVLDIDANEAASRSAYEKAVRVSPRDHNEGIEPAVESSPAPEQAPPAAELKWLENGNLLFGSYPQTAEGERRPIEWLVLKREADRALLISRYALDANLYNKEFIRTTWEQCSLRRWLNGPGKEDFPQIAFTAEERERILRAVVSADLNPVYGTDPGRATVDRLFLLSIPEAEKLFASDRARRCAPTDYAKARGVYFNADFKADGRPSCRWWLRSPGNYSYYAAYVGCDGSVNGIGFGVPYDAAGVRPAFWMKL